MNAQLRRNISALYGQEGIRWLNKLPVAIDFCSKRWGLYNLKEQSNLSCNYVMTGMQQKRPIVLKMGPESWTMNTEKRALQVFAAYGAIGLIDSMEGILLLEGARPGASLRETFSEHDDQAIEIFCECAQRLYQADTPHAGFMHVGQWLAELDKSWPIPDDILGNARILKEKLLKSAKSDKLLHGDLHHDNIIKNNNSWLVIDPKGVIGEAIFEATVFIRNPQDLLINDPRATSIIKNRIIKIAEKFGEDTQRLVQWCLVSAVLAWIWAIQDGYAPDEHKGFIKSLRQCDLL